MHPVPTENLNVFRPQTQAGRLVMLASLLVSGSVLAEAPSLNWLQGSWCLHSDSSAVEEVWLSDVGGQLIGMSRTVSGGKMTTFEFMRIVTVENRTEFIAQPGGGEGTVFTASLVAKNQLVVENLQHDFPQIISYQRQGDTLTALVSGPGENGEDSSFGLEYQRCNP